MAPPRKRGLSCGGVRRAPLLCSGIQSPGRGGGPAAGKQASPQGAPTREAPPIAPAVTAARSLPATGSAVPESVVLVQVYRSRYDWSLPWRQEAVESSLGSGFLIEGGRVVTNAHVVSDAREVLVRRPDQANPYVATVEAVGDDCDLAVLRVADPAFTKGLKPLALGDVPRSGSRVQTYGFPLGGQDVSSTAGHRLAGGVARLRAQRHRRPPRGADGRRDQPRQQRRARGAGGARGGGGLPGLPRLRQHGLLHPGAGGAPLPGRPRGRAATTASPTPASRPPLLSPAYRRERGLPEGRSGVVVDLVAPGGTADGVS